MKYEKEHIVNKSEQITERQRPPAPSAYERGRDRFADWMAEPQRRAAKEGWSHDEFDDCA